MAEKKTDNQVIADAKKKMERVVAGWFSSDPVMLGAWCIVDKIPDPRQKTFGIDSRTNPPSIRYNPYFVDSVSQEYLEAVMASEGFKLLLKHPTTRLKSPKTISNMASQITVNSCIMGSVNDQNIFNSALKADKFGMEPSQWFEFYFRELLENLPESLQKVSQMFQKQIGESGEENQQGQGQGEQGEGEEQQGEGQGEGKEGEGQGYQKFDSQGEAMKEYFDPSSTSNQDWAENDLMDADIQNMVNERKGSSKQWGKFTGDAMSSIVSANTPKISYKDIIRRFHNSVVSTKQVSSRMKVNRRYDLAQPGHRRVYKSKLLFAIDSSGSMSDDDLKEGFAVVNSLCKHSEITYLLFDYKITSVETKLKKAKKEFKVTGRGGTNFQDVIDYVNEHKYDGVIIYSDGEASAPTKPITTKVLWLLSDKSKKPPVEWGMRATLDRMENVH